MPGAGGRRVRKFFPEKSLAEEYAAKAREQLRLHGLKALELDERTRVSAVQCMELLAPFGKTIVDATEFYVDYLKRTTRAGTNGQDSSDAQSLTLGALAEHWLKVRKSSLKANSYLRLETSWNGLKPFLTDTPLLHIGPEHFEPWQTKRAAKLSWSSYNHERNFIVGLLDYAVSRRYLPSHDAKKWLPKRKPTKGQLTIPTREQFPKILESIRSQGAEDGATLVELLALSGMRVSEGIAMRWADVDFARGTFTVTGGEQGTKNGEVRVVPLFPGLRTFLERVATERGGLNRQLPSERICRTESAKKCLITACRNLGLEQMGHHAFRHYFCSNAIECGVDMKTISGWLGHKDGGVLVARTYSHLRQEHSHAMALRMGSTQPVQQGGGQ